MRALLCLLGVSGLLCAADALLPVFQKAVAALSSGDYPAAEAGFQQVLKASPNHIGALGNLGVVYSRTSRPDKAIAVYRRALRIAPQDRGLMLNLGLTYVKQESFTDALPLFEKLVAADRSNLQARELLTTCQLNTGRVAAAIQGLESLRKEDPNPAFVLYMLGIAYLKNKEPEKARSALDELVATAPPAQSNFLRGKVYYESARFEEAAEALSRGTHRRSELRRRPPRTGQSAGQPARPRRGKGIRRRAPTGPQRFRSTLLPGRLPHAGGSPARRPCRRWNALATSIRASGVLISTWAK